MKLSVQHRLRASLERRRIAPDLTRLILNDVFSPASTLKPMLIDEASWDSLIAGAQHSIFNLTSNKSRWPADMVHLYEEYRSLIHDTRAGIEKARDALVKDPDNPDGPKIPLTLARATAIAAARNRKRAAAGEPLGPACGTHWPSWVDPDIAADLTARFDRANAMRGGGRGKRVVPFATTSVIKDMNRAIVRHRKFIDDQRAIVADRPHGMGSTHYRALHLCAMRMAELWLDGYERDIKQHIRHPAFSPVPVNWLHMLTRDMRERVRRADADAMDIEPDGLYSFYDPKE